MDEWKANGYMICRSELKEPGSYKVSYLVSGEGGRSKPSDEITYLDASETLYQYQAHAGRAILYITIPYHTIPYHTIPYHTISFHTIPYHTIPYHTIPYHTIPYHTIPYHAIPRHVTSHQTTPDYLTPHHTTHYAIPLRHIHQSQANYFTLYLDVTSVSPKSGSVGGGTILTITGRFFPMDKERVTVTVGGKLQLEILIRAFSVLILVARYLMVVKVIIHKSCLWLVLNT